MRASRYYSHLSSLAKPAIHSSEPGPSWSGVAEAAMYSAPGDGYPSPRAENQNDSKLKRQRTKHKQINQRCDGRKNKRKRTPCQNASGASHRTPSRPDTRDRANPQNSRIVELCYPKKGHGKGRDRRENEAVRVVRRGK